MQAQVEARPGVRQFGVFAVIAASLLLSTMNATVVLVILPDMTEGLRTNLAWVGWSVTGYQLAQSVVMSLAGRISDQYGAKRVFLAAMGLLAMGTVAAALAPNVALLIIFRVVAAIGGGAILPTAAGIVSYEFPRHRAQAIGLFSSFLPMGWILGPLLGGVLVEHATWRWALFLTAPVSITLLTLGLALMRESRRQVQHHLDVMGAALLSTAIVCFMLALTLMRGEQEVPATLPWGLLALTIPLLGLFWRHELRTQEPIVDVALLRMLPFAATNLFNVMYGAITFGATVFIPFYATTVLGFGPTASGSMLISLEASIVVVSAVTSLVLIRRLGYRTLITAGLTLMAAALLYFGLGMATRQPLGLSVPVLWTLLTVLGLVGVGMGLIGPPSNNAGIEILPSRVSSIVGLRGMFRSAGSVVGTTVSFFVLAGYEDKAQGVVDIYLGLGMAVVATMALVFLIPTGRERPAEREGTGEAAVRRG